MLEVAGDLRREPAKFENPGHCDQGSSESRKLTFLKFKLHFKYVHSTSTDEPSYYYNTINHNHYNFLKCGWCINRCI